LSSHKPFPLAAKRDVSDENIPTAADLGLSTKLARQSSFREDEYQLGSKIRRISEALVLPLGSVRFTRDDLHACRNSVPLERRETLGHPIIRPR